MSFASHRSAIKALQKELKELSENPVEGFRVNLVDESNIFVWDVAIFGPPQTIYESGYFKARLVFPYEYPYQPPSMKFLSKMFHPNIYENGEVCISILHPPGDDPRSGELASERWNPTQNVRTILLSVISMLNEPNINSSAHITASIAYRKWKSSNGADKEYENIVRQYVEYTKVDAQKDNVVVPKTLEEYCISGGSCDGKGNYGSKSYIDATENFDEDYGGEDDDDDFYDDEDLDDEPDDLALEERPMKENVPQNLPSSTNANVVNLGQQQQQQGTSHSISNNNNNDPLVQSKPGPQNSSSVTITGLLRQ